MNSHPFASKTVCLFPRAAIPMYQNLGGLKLQKLEKEMATHSSVLALRIPGMAEPGGLPSMGSHRVGHD